MSKNIGFTKEIKEEILIIKFNSAEKMNALTFDIIKHLKDALKEADESEAINGIIITGEGPVFVSGFEIDELATMDRKKAKEYSCFGQEVLCLIESMKEPVIAAVNGFALSVGCELALACDFIFSAKSGKFAQPEINLGIIPGFGATNRLPKRIGLAKAKDLIFTGRIIGAEEALRIGLINQVFEDNKLFDNSLVFMKQLVLKPNVAMALAKDAIIRGFEMDQMAANEFEAEYFSWCFETDDQKKLMQSFQNKKPS